MRALSCLLPLLACAASGLAEPAPAPPAGNEVSLTVYSTADPAGFDPQRFIAQQRQGYSPDFAWQVPGFGVVKEVRTVDLQPGTNVVKFADVAEFIDPTTVSLADLTAPNGTAVLEQQFLFDLVSPEKLLDKYLDQSITVRVPAGSQGYETVTGTLLSANYGQLVLRTPQGVRIVPRGEAQVQLGEVPGGLITRPTLQWLLNTQTAGPHRIRTAYQTDGVTWRADYNVVLNEAETQADIGAWVSLLNLSGASYPNARLKLIAGDVQRVQPGRVPRPMAARMEGAAADAGFEEKAFFEYHLYTLPRPTTIGQNTTQQIALFPTAAGVGTEKVLVYYGAQMPGYYGGGPMLDRNFGNQSNKKVDIYVRIPNTEANKLGRPLPRGKVRVFKQDTADGTLEFIGEDLIDHTPRDEKLLVKLGQSFDVVGERTQTNYSVDQAGKQMTESFRIQIRNHKDQAQRVIIKENLYRWTNWELTANSDPFEKVDARTIHFTVDVPARGEKTVTYTVRYTW